MSGRGMIPAKRCDYRRYQPHGSRSVRGMPEENVEADDWLAFLFERVIEHPPLYLLAEIHEILPLQHSLSTHCNHIEPHLRARMAIEAPAQRLRLFLHHFHNVPE